MAIESGAILRRMKQWLVKKVTEMVSQKPLICSVLVFLAVVDVVHHNVEGFV